MSNRNGIYYWKCDRPDAFSALGKDCTPQEVNEIETVLNELCHGWFKDGNFVLEKSFGQGNHRNFSVRHNGAEYLVRLENSRDRDDYMLVETEVIARVRRLGIPAPEIFEVDTSREKYPFSYQLMRRYDTPDLNEIYKKGRLDTGSVMFALGSMIARWQDIRTPGFGLFDSDRLRSVSALEGLCGTYPEYYLLNLDSHLDFLVRKAFIDRSQAMSMRKAVEENRECLELESGCLVHKDIAFWNILGTENSIVSVIDWDDAVMGDPADDLSLMACYHSWSELKPLFEGYMSVRPLPDDFERRFWMHLLRNMIFKSVIRVGAGYFEKTGEFFLVGADGGCGLKEFTLSRLSDACMGLKGKKQIEEL